MNRWIVDGRQLTSIREVHASLVASGVAPEHYGANLDALFDVLTGSPLEVHLRGVGTLQALDRGADLLALLVDAAVENPQLVVVWNAAEESAS